MPFRINSLWWNGIFSNQRGRIESCEDYSGRQGELNIVRLENSCGGSVGKRCDQTRMFFCNHLFPHAWHFLFFFLSPSLKWQLKNLLFYFHKGLRNIRKYKEVHIRGVQKINRHTHSVVFISFFFQGVPGEAVAVHRAVDSSGGCPKLNCSCACVWDSVSDPVFLVWM